MFRWLTSRLTAGGAEIPLITPNLHLHLVVEKGEYTGQFNTRVEEIDGRRMLVAVPQEKGMAVPLREGTEVTVRFYDPHGVYQFASIVIERVRLPYAALALQLPSNRDIEQILCRSYPRYAERLTIVFRITDSPDVYRPESLHRSHTTDISCGGIGFEYAERIVAESRIRLEIHIPDEDPVLTTGARIVRCERLPGAKKENWALGVEFLGMSDDTRRRIADFLKPPTGKKTEN